MDIPQLDKEKEYGNVCSFSDNDGYCMASPCVEEILKMYNYFASYKDVKKHLAEVPGSKLMSVPYGNVDGYIAFTPLSQKARK